jgi:rhodanese-related sulfurtransferase
MSWLANQGVEALPESAKSQDAEIYVMCHHGHRSTDVTNWLAAQGWTNVFNVRGGIDAYAHEIDKTVGFY